MKRAIRLSAKDRRHLLVACVMGGSTAAIGARLLMVLAGAQRVEAEGPLLALSAVVGCGAGLVLFLQRELLQPLNQLLNALPRHAQNSVPLRLHSGIAPLQLLQRRLNALLAEWHNQAAVQQRQCNDLAHDIRAPLTRLVLRVETLRQVTDLFLHDGANHFSCPSEAGHLNAERKKHIGSEDDQRNRNRSEGTQ